LVFRFSDTGGSACFSSAASVSTGRRIGPVSMEPLASRALMSGALLDWRLRSSAALTSRGGELSGLDKNENGTAASGVSASLEDLPSAGSGAGTGVTAGAAKMGSAGALFTGGWEEERGPGGSSGRASAGVVGFSCSAESNSGCSSSDLPADLAFDDLGVGRRCFMLYGLPGGGVESGEPMPPLLGRVVLLLPPSVIINCFVR